MENGDFLTRGEGNWGFLTPKPSFPNCGRNPPKIGTFTAWNRTRTWARTPPDVTEFLTVIFQEISVCNEMITYLKTVTATT